MLDSEPDPLSMPICSTLDFNNGPAPDSEPSFDLSGLRFWSRCASHMDPSHAINRLVPHSKQQLTAKFGAPNINFTNYTDRDHLLKLYQQLAAEFSALHMVKLDIAPSATAPDRSTDSYATPQRNGTTHASSIKYLIVIDLNDHSTGSNHSSGRMTRLAFTEWVKERMTGWVDGQIAWWVGGRVARFPDVGRLAQWLSRWTDARTNSHADGQDCDRGRE
ncbi:hypothetical protein EVAR_100459_1 [Eumeta japonica]|uniref:Uncharacterized protein n=1 Tax=Eumeta variegata TaxID=151549 RepID=A0A4C1T4Y6_EUMVA|nr:hypothetical protein EVAR_100459_1 [Eumeta japonica]